MSMREGEPKEARKLTREEEQFQLQALALAAALPKPGKQPRFDKQIIPRDEFVAMDPGGNLPATILGNSVSIDRIESKEE